MKNLWKKISIVSLLVIMVGSLTVGTMSSCAGSKKTGDEANERNDKNDSNHRGGSDDPNDPNR